MFSQSERKEKKKAISNGVNVQVVVRVYLEISGSFAFSNEKNAPVTELVLELSLRRLLGGN